MSIKTLQSFNLNPRCIATAPPLPRLRHCQLFSGANAIRVRREGFVAPRQASMLRFNLDFIHVLKYLLQGCCVGIYIPWMGNARTRMCVCAHPAPQDHSSANKARAVFNFQRCQPDQRQAGSWYISWAAGLIVCLHFLHRYPEMYEYKFRAIVKTLVLPGGNSNGRFPDYIHKQQVNLLCSAWWT